MPNFFALGGTRADLLHDMKKGFLRRTGRVSAQSGGSSGAPSQSSVAVRRLASTNPKWGQDGLLHRDRQQRGLPNGVRRQLTAAAQRKRTARFSQLTQAEKDKVLAFMHEHRDSLQPDALMNISADLQLSRDAGREALAEYRRYSKIFLPDLWDSYSAGEKQRVMDAFGVKADEKDVVLHFNNADITRKQFRSLKHGTWINDEVMNCILTLLQWRGHSDDSTTDDSSTGLVKANLMEQVDGRLRAYAAATVRASVGVFAVTVAVTASARYRVVVR